MSTDQTMKEVLLVSDGLKPKDDDDDAIASNSTPTEEAKTVVFKSGFINGSKYFVNEWVECMYEGKWYVSQITDIDKNEEKESENNINRVKVHFKGWDIRYDEWINATTNDNNNIVKLYTHTKKPTKWGVRTPNDVQDLDKIGTKCDILDDNNIRREGTVIGCDSEYNYVEFEYSKQVGRGATSKQSKHTLWLNQDSYRIAPLLQWININYNQQSHQRYNSTPNINHNPDRMMHKTMYEQKLKAPATRETKNTKKSTKKVTFLIKKKEPTVKELEILIRKNQDEIDRLKDKNKELKFKNKKLAAIEESNERDAGCQAWGNCFIIYLLLFIIGLTLYGFVSLVTITALVMMVVVTGTCMICPRALLSIRKIIKANDRK